MIAKSGNKESIQNLARLDGAVKRPAITSKYLARKKAQEYPSNRLIFGHK